ncbi:hypothetical protein [Algibacter marinivivus]|uniref:hypothetical protein n=1 Tax=Algibacter marinivivus TaxID=2100723 RepID=UPI0011B21C6D|nr:hypothetical protein [Algibacter marinivivus]
MNKALEIIFQKKTLSYILFLITAAIIREALALGFDENFENLFIYLNERYNNNDVDLYILILQLLFTKGSYITLLILFVLLSVFVFLKNKELKKLTTPNADSKDFQKLRKKINKIISEESFPEIYNSFFHKLTTKFSPVYSEFYLRNLEIQVDVSSIDNNEIEFYQFTRVLVLPDKTQKYFKFKHPINNQIQTEYSAQLMAYKVDEIDFMDKLERDVLEFETIFESKREFFVEYKHKFKYSILDNPYHLFKMNTYCSNLYFSIIIPENFEIGLFDLGNNDLYVIEDSRLGNKQLRFKMENGFMPNDGFGIYYKK